MGVLDHAAYFGETRVAVYFVVCAAIFGYGLLKRPGTAWTWGPITITYFLSFSALISRYGSATQFVLWAFLLIPMIVLWRFVRHFAKNRP